MTTKMPSSEVKYVKFEDNVAERLVGAEGVEKVAAEIGLRVLSPILGICNLVVLDNLRQD